MSNLPSEKEHLLALKVMKLTRPSFAALQPSDRGRMVRLDPWDVDAEEDPFAVTNANDVNFIPETPYDEFGPALVLPQSFGNVHLGEHFSCYLSVHNPSKIGCRNVQVKIEIQTQTQRQNLLTADHPTSIAEIPPSHCVNYIVHYDMREVGTHIVVCNVSYVSMATNRSESLRKFYKFNVTRALDYRFKVTEVQEGSFFYEICVQNTKPSGLYLDKVLLIPSSEFLCDDLNVRPTASANPEDETVDDLMEGYLAPMESYQYLFKLTPNPKYVLENNPYTKGRSQAPSTNTVGFLDVHWVAEMGEKGREYLTLLGKPPNRPSNLQVKIVAMPSSVVLETPTDVSLELRNNCDRALSLRVELENRTDSGIVWTGISGRHISRLDPKETIVLNYQFLPVKPGLQTISGVRVVDLLLNQPIELKNLGSIFVDLPSL